MTGRQAPPEPEGLRARRMAERLERALEVAGLAPGDLRLVAAAHAEAMELRVRALPSDHDPRYLHPGRTVLILLDDGGLRDPLPLAAGALLDSAYPELEAGVEPARRLGGEELARWLDGVPRVRWEGEERSEDGGLVERLVAAQPALLTVVLGEALDHLRHAHLLEDPGLRAGRARIASELLAPLAERLGGSLARRYRWWLRRVAPSLGSP